MKQINLLLTTGLLLIFLPLTSCMKYGPSQTEDFPPGPTGEGLLIINEGNFMYANASLTYYIPGSGKTENEVFFRANGINLGDVAQSLSIFEGNGYIVVNNSGVIFVIDPNTFRLKGSITGLISPRYIHFIDKRKAYVTDLYQEKITIVDPQSFRILGYIPVTGHRSTEKMVQWENFVFVTCWSYDNKILVIDTVTDRVTDSLEVGYQPTDLLLDSNGKIWCAAAGNLYRIDARSRKIEKIFPAQADGARTYLAMNASRDTLYYLNKSLWRMGTDQATTDIAPFIVLDKRTYYGLAVDPVTSHVYVADALDYVQQGKVYRFNNRGVPVDTLTTGVNPGFFCFK
ncbi:MAG: YncE family protein [Bacteroidales bacterium]|nr:YncE family protein [Bacteroidales bacterium]MDD4030329.1 YncE family protein [Bacteroidales bacterium]MDD4434812.1 YncE family protein [Bacteroidales bacterium]MDD5733041.1 YncE family protein [Bacteroidales bacterium]